MDLYRGLAGGLIVSCQAPRGDPLHSARIMAALARAAELGGAVAIRANGPSHIRAIRRATRLPIIGIYKLDRRRFPVYITPTPAHARLVADAGADIVAVDATLRTRSGGMTAGELIGAVKETVARPVMADVSTLEEGVAAAEAGADLIATTLAGYTSYSRKLAGPDLRLVAELSRAVPVPVVAEGRIRTPQQARRALAAGALAVVVGTAITRPQWITQRFVAALRRAHDGPSGRWHAG